MRFVFNILKRFIYSAFLLYGFNLFSVNFNLIIPINIFNVIFISVLGIPSLIGLIIFKLLFLWGGFLWS